MSAIRRTRLSVLVATSLLIATTAAWILKGELSPWRLLFALLATAPLWALLPSLLRGQRRSYAAATLCIVPYLVIALMELLANPAARLWASAVLGLAFAVFVMSIAFLRVTRSADA